MSKLLPCPFCGSPAQRCDVPADTEDDNAGASYIECSRCSACTALHFDRKENLERSWNDRVKPALSEPIYKAVERILDEHSAWIARPDREVTERIALACTIAAVVVIEKAQDDEAELADD